MKNVFSITLLLSVIACAEKPPAPVNPPHYDLRKPVQYDLPPILHEISGIAFNDKKSDLIYAEQDELGTLFHFHLGESRIAQTRFGKKGDFEDVTVLHNTAILLRSDGRFFSFPLEESSQETATNTREWNGLLPGGEYESLFGDESDGKLYVLCKNCPGDKQDKEISGYTFTLSENGDILPSGSFRIDMQKIAVLSGQKKMRIKPSAMAKNARTGQWFILSSVSSVLVITDVNWNPSQVIRLDPQVFGQPEGIAFDAQDNLYISNEGNETKPGNILRFNHQP